MKWLMTILGASGLTASVWFYDAIYAWAACPPDRAHCDETGVLYVLTACFIFPSGMLWIGLAGLVNRGPLGDHKFDAKAEGRE